MMHERALMTENDREDWFKRNFNNVLAELARQALAAAKVQKAREEDHGNCSIYILLRLFHGCYIFLHSFLFIDCLSSHFVALLRKARAEVFHIIER